MNERETPRELCLRCMILLEDAGYELERIGEPHKLICANCREKAWSYTCRVAKSRLGSGEASGK